MAKVSVITLALLFLLGCAARSCAMSQCDYDDIQLGTPISEVVAQLGEPYAIHSKGGDTEEYEYIERFSTENTLIYENHFFLTVVNGSVTSKRSTQERRPAYDLLWQADPNVPTYP